MKNEKELKAISAFLNANKGEETYTTISAKTGIDDNQIGKYFRGEQEPGSAVFMRISTVLNIPANTLYAFAKEIREIK
jgi:transcriptional regulator with XRE-family HTH domain